MTNIELLRQWYRQVKAGETPQTINCVAVDPSDFWVMHTAATKAMQALSEMMPAKLHGVGNIRENGFTLKAGRSSFTVTPGKKTPGVAETSIAAYHAKDRSQQAKEVAEAVIKMHNNGAAWVSDKMIEAQMTIPAARISARRNEIEKAGGITVNGDFYKFLSSGTKIKCPVTQSTVNGWALRKEGTLF